MSVETSMGSEIVHEASQIEAEKREIERLMPPPRRGMSERFETSHTERWEITFKATVPAGLTAAGRSYTAAEILKQRMTQVLMQAGVSDPEVQVRKIGRSTHRGEWEPGVEYDAGETVEWHQTYWIANEANCNIKPGGERARRGGRGHPSIWAKTEHIHDAPDPFFTVIADQETKRLALEEATNASGDEIMAVVEVPQPWHGPGPRVDEDIVDAEIVDQ